MMYFASHLKGAIWNPLESLKSPDVFTISDAPPPQMTLTIIRSGFWTRGNEGLGVSVEGANEKLGEHL